MYITQPLKSPVTASCKNPLIETETLVFPSLSGGTEHAQQLGRVCSQIASLQGSAPREPAALETGSDSFRRKHAACGHGVLSGILTRPSEAEPTPPNPPPPLPAFSAARHGHREGPQPGSARGGPMARPIGAEPRRLYVALGPGGLL